MCCAAVDGCDSNRVYEQNYEITNAVWNKDSVLVFKVDVKDSISEHNLIINIRNISTYTYSNLFMFVRVISPQGNMIKDTIECTLAEKSGKWLGSGTGGVYDFNRLYKSSVKFPVKGIYTFQLQHAMREDDLEDISDIGFRIEKINE